MVFLSWRLMPCAVDGQTAARRNGNLKYTGNEDMTCLSFSEQTNTGRCRKRNEDNLVSLPARGVFCIADGMGGTDRGELASGLLVANVREAFTAKGPCEGPSSLSWAEGLFVEAVRGANDKMRALCREQMGISMGTTVVAVLIDPDDTRKAITMHAGDSRVYVFRGETLLQKTSDHSVAGMLGATGDSLVGTRFKGAITRCVGIADTVDLERNELRLMNRDVIMLCSDGLHVEVPLDAMTSLFQRHANGSLDLLATALVTEANRRGGKDNVSVILVRVEDSNKENVGP